MQVSLSIHGDGKLNQLSTSEATNENIHNIRLIAENRLFIKDNNSGHNFLIDSGSVFSVFPVIYLKRVHHQQSTDFQLCAANASSIKTFGIHILGLNIGLRKPFVWAFIVADIQTPIIGADFLHKLELLVDIKNKKLIDKITNISARAQISFTPDYGISAVQGQFIYQDVINEFPSITSGFSHPTASIKSAVLHHICTIG